MKRIIAALGIILIFGGCSVLPEKVLQAGPTGSNRFEAPDVDAAIEIAVQAKDSPGEACYRAIRKHIEPEVRAQPVGPVSTYAAARIRTREARAGLDPEIRQACAALILDASTFASRLGLTFGTALP